MVVGGCAGEHSDAVHSVFNDLKALAAGAEEDTRGQVAVGFSRHGASTRSRKMPIVGGQNVILGMSS